MNGPGITAQGFSALQHPGWSVMWMLYGGGILLVMTASLGWLLAKFVTPVLFAQEPFSRLGTELAYHLTVAHNGSTTNPRTGRPVLANAWAYGLADTEMRLRQLSPAAIQGYLRLFADLFTATDVYLGIWSNNGWWYLDAVRLEPDFSAAVRLAAAEGQRCIFHLFTHEEHFLSRDQREGAQRDFDQCCPRRDHLPIAFMYTAWLGFDSATPTDSRYGVYEATMAANHQRETTADQVPQQASISNVPG